MMLYQFLFSKAPPISTLGRPSCASSGGITDNNIIHHYGGLIHEMYDDVGIPGNELVIDT